MIRKFLATILKYEKGIEELTIKMNMVKAQIETIIGMIEDEEVKQIFRDMLSIHSPALFLSSFYRASKNEKARKIIRESLPDTKALPDANIDL